MKIDLSGGLFSPSLTDKGGSQQDKKNRQGLKYLIVPVSNLVE